MEEGVLPVRVHPPDFSLPPPPFPQAALPQLPAPSPAELFCGGAAELEYSIQRANPTQLFVGLEYVVEVQVPAEERTKTRYENSYACMLCDQVFESDRGRLGFSGKKKILEHLSRMSHKLTYLNKHFPLVKERMLEPPAHECTLEGIDKVVSKIEEVFGRLKLKVVRGFSKFKINQEVIQRMVDKGEHIREDYDFIVTVTKKGRRSGDSGESKTRHKSSSSNQGKKKTPEIEVVREKTLDLIDKVESFISTSPKDPAVIKDKSSSSIKKSPKKRRSSSSKDKNEKERSRDRSMNKNKKRKDKSKSRSSSRRRKDKKLKKSSKPRSKSRSKERSKKKKRSKSRDVSRSRSRKRNKSGKTSSSKKDQDRKDRSHSGKRSEDRTRFKPDRKSLEAPFNSQESRPLCLKQEIEIVELSDEEEVKREKSFKAQKDLESKVGRYLADEALLLKHWAAQKQIYCNEPNKHPAYEAEWGKFWKAKYAELTAAGVDHTTYNMEPEWIEAWTKLFEAEQRRGVEAEKELLREKHEVTYSDIEVFRARGPCTDSQASTSTRAQPETDSLVSTLNLLGGLETKGSLGKGLSFRLLRLKNEAYELEASKNGASMELLHTKDCHSLLVIARERLRSVANGSLEAKLALQSLAGLLKVSRCEEDEILEVSQPSPPHATWPASASGGQESAQRLDVEAELRRQFLATGRTLTQADMAALVEAELVRQRHQLPPAGHQPVHHLLPLLGLGQPQPEEAVSPPPMLLPGEAPSQAFSAYSHPLPLLGDEAAVDWGSIQHIVSSVNSSSQAEPGDQAHPDTPIKDPRLTYFSMEEMKVLVSNFKTLDKDEQSDFVQHMRLLEDKDPEQVKIIKKQFWRDS